ncbi:transposase [Streptomyces sp. IMTB 2501]|uniref:transposase n=1 Tax=Streptomyces sp. IMTB 2501 TaxID=1776340 RepID=UPI0021160CE1|nr:transposase [Streptomyces sp. IMTB 2501]
MVTVLGHNMADRGGIVGKAPAPNTSRRCSACGFVIPGCRETQARFVCKNPDCGFKCSAETNTSRSIDHAAGLAMSGLDSAPFTGRRQSRHWDRAGDRSARHRGCGQQRRRRRLLELTSRARG